MENQDQSATPLKKNLIAALAKMQGAIQNPKKDTDNPFFKSKYADLASVWDSVRTLLSENGLAFVQMPATEGNKVSVTGVLLHVSGESIESTITGTAKDTMPQSIGSCITYLRRYQLSAMLGIAAEDDDGNAASQPAKKEKTAAQERPTFDKGIPYDQHLAEMETKEKAKPEVPPQVDHGSFEDKIKSAKIASTGKKGNTPWTLYSIETEGHGAFSTFSATIFEDAKTAIDANVITWVHTEPTPKGPKINGIEFRPAGHIDDLELSRAVED